MLQAVQGACVQPISLIGNGDDVGERTSEQLTRTTPVEPKEIPLPNIEFTDTSPQTANLLYENALHSYEKGDLKDHDELLLQVSEHCILFNVSG